MRTHSETVSFRVDQDLLRLIDKERSRFGISRGSWARGAIVSHLHHLPGATDEQKSQNLDERFDALESLLDSLAGDVAKSLYFILTRVGEMSTEEAKDLIRARLGQ